MSEILNDRRAVGNVWRLAAAQALAGGNASVIFATAAIVGSTMAPDKSLATLPISIFVVGMALATLPAGWLARHYGRRITFLSGAGLGGIGGLICAAGILTSSFALYCVGTLLCGLYSAISQSYRFAATDTASEAYKPKAISYVMAGGVLAGVLGPQLVQFTMNVWPPYLFAASYVAQALVAVVAMIVLAGIDIPVPSSVSMRAGRPLLEIVRQPKFIIAALCGTVSYVLMNLVMTSAPLAMKICGLSLSQSNYGIQWHIVAMFGPSFFTGTLIARFGVHRIVFTGMVLIALCAVVDLAGIGVWNFWIGLILLGLGWNFGYIGATAMVVATHRPEERNKVQAFNDFLIFGTMAFGSFASGHLLEVYGWSVVNWVVFPPIVIGILALWLSARWKRNTVISAS